MPGSSPTGSASNPDPSLALRRRVHTEGPAESPPRSLGGPGLRLDPSDPRLVRSTVPEVPPLFADANTIFLNQEKTQLQRAKSVWVVAYSSTGGGHLARCLDPVIKAIEMEVISKGDLICLALPEQWVHDKGAARKTLQKFEFMFSSKGIDVIMKQMDKTITGLYKQDGSSDNTAIIRNFVDKPWRQVPLPVVNTILRGRQQSFSAKSMLEQLVDAAGDATKVRVLSDMGVYAIKAAIEAGVPQRQVIEMGNHATLLDPAVDHEGKSLAFLSKATADGRAGTLGLIRYDSGINPLVSMRTTLEQFGVTAQSSCRATRETIVDFLLEHAKRNDLDPATDARAGIIVAPGRAANEIDGAFYLYVNEYTPAATAHIKQRIRDDDPEYCSTMFVICGAGVLPDSVPGNPLHMMYAAQADGAMNAGYGTTSEAHYLLERGFQGKLLLMPVEHQHEQEANARTLHELLGERITVATDKDSFLTRLDERVSNRTTASALTGDMSRIVSALHNPRTNLAHIADLIAGGPMLEIEADLLARGKAIGESPDTKAMRRMAKMILPALDAVIEGNESFKLKMTAKQPETHHTLSSLISALKDDSQFAELLRLDNIGGDETERFRAQFMRHFMTLSELSLDERKPYAERVRNELGDRFVLGY